MCRKKEVTANTKLLKKENYINNLEKIENH